jgi:hypothetical protein
LNFRRVRIDHSGVRLNINFAPHRSDLQNRVDSPNLRGLEHNVVGHKRLEPRLRHGQAVGPALQVRRLEISVAIRGKNSLHIGLRVDDFELSANDHRAAGITHMAANDGGG